MRPAESQSETSKLASGVSSARWVYPLALAVTIIFASGRGQIAAPDIVNIDKAAHLAVFGLLATLVMRSPGLRHAWVAVAAVSLFGAADELRQSLTPGRFVEVADWAADSVGAVLAVTAYRFWPWYRGLLETPLGLRKRARKSVSTAVPESAA
jgi:hypothetical protein